MISTERLRRPGRAQGRGGCRLHAIVPLVIAAFAVMAGGVRPARAATTTERSASILIFPKVVFDGSRDTFIQLTNTSNQVAYAKCFYVNAAPLCIGNGDCLAGTCNGTCEPQWVEVDFNLTLTKQQPTHWSAGRGRLSNPNDLPCDPTHPECDDAGFDPGRIPPVTQMPFQGELRCIEVEKSGAPISGNHLKGEATIVSSDGDSSGYNAIGLLGNPVNNNSDNVLCVGGDVTDECRNGPEYDGCGERLILNAFSEGADDPLFGPTSQVATELTLVPCAEDFERQMPTSVTVQFLVFDEFELRFSASKKFECWLTIFLGQIPGNIFQIRTAQTRFVEASIRPAIGNSGFVGVAEEYHRMGQQQARVAFNIAEEGTHPTTDLIVIPEGP